MKLHTDQTGSHIIAVALAVVIIGAIGFMGYRVMQHQTLATAKPAATTSLTKAPATITTKSDLSQAAKSLDSSGNDVNNSVNGSSLNNDLSDML